MTLDEPSGGEGGGDGFSRVHPLSPFIRGGLVVIAVFGYVLSQQIDRVVGAAGPPAPGEGETSLLVPAVLVLLTVVGAVLLGLLSWWFTRYRLGDTGLEMHSGAIMRQHRQVRYDRIQAVDLVRPLLARMTGLSEVRVESAGGGDSHVSIAYLRHTDAEAVRARLLGLAAEAQQPTPSPGPEGGMGSPDSRAELARPKGGPVPPAGPEGPWPGRGAAEPAVPLLRVPVERLIASVLLSWDTIFFLALLCLALVLTFVDLGVVIGGFLPVVLITGMRSIIRLTRWYGLTVALRGQTLTSQRGLTDTRHSSVPLQRVQALEVQQPVLWRRAGWWTLKVNVAGARIASADGDSGESVLVPVATTDEVLRLLEAVTADPVTTAEVASLVADTPEGFVGVPSAARWFHPFARRRIGYLPGRRAVLTRSGWLDRVLQVVPWGRIQSMTLQQGPLDRRLDLASVQFLSTVGPVRPRVEHLSTDDAQRLAHLAAARASHARRRSSGPVGCDPTPDTVDWP
ncbi:PH domain-containing protein [Janibacter sp. DB-40]|uniref:PH domain-containing protein n=1 Tax=Janibacter sp. DB-40 TaxID=3028808 RepID=UPI00240733B2|nr:PH domain-containing protein [Janibacter sp. DB-40]